MLEGAYWSTKLRPLLVHHHKLRNAGAVIVKHANPYASGLPDFSISIGRHTEFFELKMYPNTVTKLQAWHLKRLGEAGHLITVYKNSIMLDELCFSTPNPLHTLIEEIVAICIEQDYKKGLCTKCGKEFSI